MSQKQNERPDVPEQEERLSAPQENGAEETAAPAEEAVHQPETPAAGAETEPSQTEEEAFGEEEKGEKKNTGFAAALKSRRFRHGAASTGITIGVIAVIILLNVVVSLLVERFPSLNIDMTATGGNTLSQTAADVANAVSEETNIYILAREEYVKNDQLYASYGITYSQVDVLAKKFAEVNGNIKVQYVDLDANPGFASQYADENLQTGDVIVQSPLRYRRLTVDDLFSFNSQTYTAYTKVDSALASAIYQVNVKDLPTVAFATGHNEMLDTTAFRQLLTDNGFEASEFALLTDEIPENAQVIFLPTPATDYTDEEIAKLEAFLEEGGDRGLFIAFHPGQTEFPKLAAFLKDWGIAATDNIVLESDSSHVFSNSSTYILSQLSEELDLGGKSDYGYLAMPSARQLERLFTSEAGVNTYTLLSSYDTSYAYPLSSLDQPTGEEEKTSYPLALLAQKTKNTDSGSSRSHVIALGSSVMLADGIINTSTFGNGQYMLDLLHYVTGTTDSSSPVEIVTTAINSADLVLTMDQAKWLGLGLFTIGIPLVVLIVGFVVFFRRRHL